MDKNIFFFEFQNIKIFQWESRDKILCKLYVNKMM